MLNNEQHTDAFVAFAVPEIGAQKHPKLASDQRCFAASQDDSQYSGYLRALLATSMGTSLEYLFP